MSVTPATIQILVPAGRPIMLGALSAPLAGSPYPHTPSAATAPSEAPRESCQWAEATSVPLSSPLPPPTREPPATQAGHGSRLLAALADNDAAKRTLGWRSLRVPAPRVPQTHLAPRSLPRSGASARATMLPLPFGECLAGRNGLARCRIGSVHLFLQVDTIKVSIWRMPIYSGFVETAQTIRLRFSMNSSSLSSGW
jgi:hypothetical protein